MEIEELRAFVEIAKSGGISTAARRLGLSKSIISRRLVQLENKLGTQLIFRNTRGTSLTEAGSVFQEHAIKIISEIDTAKERIFPKGDLCGTLRVAVPLSFGPTHFAPVLAEMALRYPQLHIHACYSDRFVDFIAEGFDCGIRVGYLKDSNLIAKCIGPFCGKIVASPDYLAVHGTPQTIEDLLSHQAIMQGTESWRFVHQGELMTVYPQGRFKADNGSAILQAVIAGVGIGYLPDGLVHEALGLGQIVTIMTDYVSPPRGGIYLVRPAGQNSTRKIKALIEILTEFFQEGLKCPIKIKKNLSTVKHTEHFYMQTILYGERK